jgi:PHD/YefM family antitoxin component YafN of YafNO toxin-antitoxin module
MSKLNIKDVQKNLFHLNSNKKDINANLISVRDWKATCETIFLNSIPRYVQTIKEAREENKNEMPKYVKGEEW